MLHVISVYHDERIKVFDRALAVVCMKFNESCSLWIIISFRLLILLTLLRVNSSSGYITIEGFFKLNSSIYLVVHF